MRSKYEDPDFDDRMVEYSEEDSDDERPKVRTGAHQQTVMMICCTRISQECLSHQGCTATLHHITLCSSGKPLLQVGGV
jgi:hypothetical protein